MKYTQFLFAILILATAGLFSCDKDNNTGGNSCETVVNANGPAFLKVINDYPQTVQVYMGDFIPFGSELRSDHCEIYGLPAGSGSIEISTLDGSKVRNVPVTMEKDQTEVITVDPNFF